MTLLEITIAVIVFATALLPVLMLTTTNVKRTASMEDHVLAAEFAAGVLDRYLSLPFQECRLLGQKEASSRGVLEELGQGGAGGRISTKSFLEALQKSYRGFSWQVKVTPGTGKEESEQMLTVTVTVKWPADPAAKLMRQFSLSAVKFNENP